MAAHMPHASTSKTNPLVLGNAIPVLGMKLNRGKCVV